MRFADERTMGVLHTTRVPRREQDEGEASERYATASGNSSQRSMDAVLDREEPMVQLRRSYARPRQHYAKQLKKRTRTTQEWIHDISVAWSQ